MGSTRWVGQGVRVKTEWTMLTSPLTLIWTATLRGRAPMGRFALADDIARSIALLANERESGFVNGHTLAVDGGWTADGSWESSGSDTREVHVVTLSARVV
jgi:NAD(P)-dependent dehydrogenase (short-subunit alcohol dehydrogenase family)